VSQASYAAWEITVLYSAMLNLHNALCMIVSWYTTVQFMKYYDVGNVGVIGSY